MLSRAKKTTELVLAAALQPDVPIERNWRLNERHYGALTGLSKKETMAKLGAEATMAVRRGSAVPPLITEDHAMWPHIMNCESNVDLAKAGAVPRGESLAMCRSRVTEFWRSDILPQLKQLARDSPRLTAQDGAPPTVLIVSHMHTLRLLIAELDGLDNEQLRALDVPTAVPFLYRLDVDLVPVDPKVGAVLAGTTSNAGLRGRWLGDLGLASMTVSQILSLVLRRRGALYELLPHLPERVQEIFVRTGFSQTATMHAVNARRAHAPQAELSAPSADPDAVELANFVKTAPPLRASEQLAALRSLYRNRPWAHMFNDAFCDSCAAALQVVSAFPSDSEAARGGDEKAKRRDGKEPGYLVDDRAALASWANARPPPRAAAAALHKLASSPNQAAGGTVVKFDRFPEFAKIAAVVAYLGWLKHEGASYLPERGCQFAKAVAQPGMLSTKEIEEDLQRFVDSKDAGAPPRAFAAPDDASEALDDAASEALWTLLRSEAAADAAQNGEMTCHAKHEARAISPPVYGAQ